MTEVGTSAKKAVEFLVAFFGHVSKLLIAVDEGASKARLEPIHSACYWGSRAVYSPSLWIARSLHRVYGQVPIPKKSDAIPLAVFFGIYLTPRVGPQPVAMWGLAAQRKAESIYPRFDRLIYATEGPDFLVSETEESWKPEPSMGFDTFEFRACPLVQLGNLTVVENAVLNPLFERVKEFSKPALSGDQDRNKSDLS
jgi:hypothetical protein